MASRTLGSIALVVALTATAHAEWSADAFDEENALEDGLRFVEPMKNYTNLREGEAVKLRCVVSGGAVDFRWIHNENPLVEERGRVRVKSGNGVSRVRFRSLDVMDTGFYRCEASDGRGNVVSGESFVKVFPAGAAGGPSHHDEDGDDDYHYEDYEHGLIPDFAPVDFSADLSGGIDGLPPHLQHGVHPDRHGAPAAPSLSSSHAHLPVLKPTDHAGRCEPYTGHICRGYLHSSLVFISDGLTQDYVERKLRASLEVNGNFSSQVLNWQTFPLLLPSSGYRQSSRVDRRLLALRRARHMPLHLAVVRRANEETQKGNCLCTKLWRYGLPASQHLNLTLSLFNLIISGPPSASPCSPLLFRLPPRGAKMVMAGGGSLDNGRARLGPPPDGSPRENV